MVVSRATDGRFCPNNNRYGAGRVDGRSLQCQIVDGRLWFVSMNAVHYGRSRKSEDFTMEF